MEDQSWFMDTLDSGANQHVAIADPWQSEQIAFRQPYDGDDTKIVGNGASQP